MRALGLFLACLFLIACGHSDEEMHAAIEAGRRQCMAHDAPPYATPTTTHDGCTKDTDCKGGRVCDDGRCAEPAH